ncbi:DUF4092 domain-containing protein [Escherichia coli]
MAGIGNPHYNSILCCPNGYSWNGGVNKDGQAHATVTWMT